MIAEYTEPSSYTEAMQSVNQQEWLTAMDNEMSSLIENHTWNLVEKPPDRLVVENRWVYRVKTNLDGSVDKFKARLVAKGYSQKADIDYTETFSPVIRFDTIRAMLSVHCK
jgi:Reverse transcriptase (RNA-dependent DNA polymerase)